MSNLVEVHLCCNDPDSGEFDGLLSAVSFSDDADFLSLEGDLTDGDMLTIDADTIRLGLGGDTFEHHGHSTWVGNCCWDAVLMEQDEAASLANYLRGLPHWDCTVAKQSLFGKWERGELYTADDFKEAAKHGDVV